MKLLRPLKQILLVVGLAPEIINVDNGGAWLWIAIMSNLEVLALAT